MLLDAPGRPLRPPTSPMPRRGPGEVLVRVAGVRRLPHRPPRRRRRAARSEAAARPGPRDRRHGRGARRRRGRRSRVGDRVGVPWLGWTCGRCRFCLRGAREPLRRRALHRLPDRRRLRRVRRRRRALLLPAARGAIGDVDGRAAALRRADRLSRAAHGRRRAARSASTASAPPRTSSRRWRGIRAARLRVHPAGDDGSAGTSRASSARSGPATRPRPRPSRSTPRIIFAPVGALVPAALARGASRAASWCAAAST